MPDNEHNDGNSNNPKGRKNQNTRAITLILIVALIPFGSLAFIAWYFVNEHSERIKFLTTNTLSLFVLVAIVIQAFIYWKQRDLMERQAEAMKDSLIETRNLIAQNEKFSRINSRAYVFIDTASLDAPISSGKFPLPRIVFKNSGRSPAYSHRARIEQAFLTGEALENAKKGIMPKIRPLNRKGLGIIGAGHTTVIHWERGHYESIEEERLAMTGKSTYYLWGFGCYSDIFGKEHSSKFSLYARSPKVTELSYGWFGNEAEDEEEEQEQPKAN